MLQHRWQRLALVAVMVLSPQLLHAADPAPPADNQTVDGTRIYLGVIPSAMIRGHPREHSETSMHGGIPPDDAMYHVLVSLFDSQSGQRIVDAEVRATVAEPGLTGEAKALELMAIAGTQTYGNYFRMLGPGPFTIRAVVRRPGRAQAIEVRFLHRHQ